MDRNEAEQLAKRLLNEFGLGDVEFKWSSGKRQLGAAVWKRNRFTREFTCRQLRLSRTLVDFNDFNEVNDVIRHEIAHLLCGPGVGHGPQWRLMAIRCGARPERCNTTAAAPEPKFCVYCMCCGRILAKRHTRKMQIHRRSCVQCGKKSLGMLVWKENAAA